MGQKVHPYVLRIGFGKNWLSRWFVDRRKNFADYLEEDVKVRAAVKKFYPEGSIARVNLERVSDTTIKIIIETSRPGVIIGRRGGELEKLKALLAKITKREIMIEVPEVSDPEKEAQLIAELIAFQILKRVNYRRAMKRAIQQALDVGCEGIKIRCSGRLGGAEIARSEIYKQGKVPLQTFRSDIDYGFAISKTTYGTIGVKVWAYQGEKHTGAYLEQIRARAQEAKARAKDKAMAEDKE